MARMTWPATCGSGSPTGMIHVTSRHPQTEIPAVPTAAFKAAPLVCGGPEAAEIVFRTSGTTGGPENRGAHHVRDLRLYEASALPNFRAHMLPENAWLPMLILGPTLKDAPDSSLTWMLERVKSALGATGSAHPRAGGQPA